ncbi:MAG: hypothetical protein CMH82_00310 [Nocardioides sp.]|nr:hypothetical protein [Nocardioides sp.]
MYPIDVAELDEGTKQRIRLGYTPTMDHSYCVQPILVVQLQELDSTDLGSNFGSTSRPKREITIKVLMPSPRITGRPPKN